MTAEPIDLAEVRQLAGTVRARHCEPGTDGQAHRLAYVTGLLADELEQKRRTAAEAVQRAIELAVERSEAQEQRAKAWAERDEALKIQNATSGKRRWLAGLRRQVLELCDRAQADLGEQSVPPYWTAVVRVGDLRDILTAEPVPDDPPHETVFAQIAEERARQDAKWGQQNHPDGTGPDYALQAAFARQRCEQAAREGRLTWHEILDEEVTEAFAEHEPAALRAELIQVAAVATAWAEAIDRRLAGDAA